MAQIAEVQCPECGGKGKRPTWEDHPDQQPEWEWAKCDACNGRCVVEVVLRKPEVPAAEPTKTLKSKPRGRKG